MTDKLTKAQERVLREMYRLGLRDPFTLVSRFMGGAFRRMITRMHDDGLLDGKLSIGGDYYKSHEITHKGLVALAACGVEVPGEVLVAREALELERKQRAHADWNKQQMEADKRKAERKAKIIEKVGKEIDFENDDLWHIITRIVEIHEGTA